MNASLRIAKRLRHDLKYTGLTAKNLDPKEELAPWAIHSLFRDLFQTRENKSALSLVQEACESLKTIQTLQTPCQNLLFAARALEKFYTPLSQGKPVSLVLLQNAVDMLLDATEKLCDAAKKL